MIKAQIDKLNKLQFSDFFLTWALTLLFLPMALYFRFIIGTSLVLDKDFSTLKQTAWILGLILLLWLVWKWFFDDRLIITGLEVYIGSFFLIACLSTAFSINISLSLEKLLGISVYLFGIYLLLDLKRFPRVWAGIINALLITAGFSSLLILLSAIPWLQLYQITPLQILTDPTYLLKVIPRLPDSLRLHQSVTAGYLVMIIPLAVYQLNQTRTLYWKSLQITGLVINITVLFLTQSRGGLLGLFFLVLVLVILYRKRIWTFILQNRILGISSLSALVLAGTAFIFLFGISRGFSLGDRTIQMRFNQWRIAFEIIKQHPLLGSGLGTFGQKYLELRDPEFFAGTFIHAHNQLIQITTELGILGLFTLLILIWQGIRLLHKDKGGLPSSSKVSLIALGGLFGVLIPDAILTSSMIVLLLLIYLVWLIPTEKPPSTIDRTKGLGLLSLAAVLLVSSVGWILWKIQPYDLALEAAQEGNWQEASSALLFASERDPDNPYYQHALGFTEGQAACQIQEYGSQAVNSYQRSFDTYQNWGIDHANAAVVYAIKGDYQNAADHMEVALQNFPQNSSFYCLLGDYYILLNNTEDAIKSYVRCIAERPRLLDSPYWQEDKNRQELTPIVSSQVQTDLRSRVDNESLKLLAEFYLTTNDLDNADLSIQEYLKQNPNDLRGNIIYFKILESADALSTAKENIEQLLRNHPRHPDLWFLMGKIAQKEGNDTYAEVALNIGYRLQPTPERSWILGQHYASQGDLDQAQEFYFIALNSIPGPMMDFSRRVAGRWPLPGEYLDCMPIIRTNHKFFIPALNAARDLEDQHCMLAACIYQGLVELEPGSNEALIRLNSLSCKENFDASRCFYDLNN